jgi:hypothetical protein
MKRQEKCIRCEKTFWSKAKKNKATGEIVNLDNVCQGCKNQIRIRQMKRSDTIRVIPAEFEKLIRMRELVMAEGKRRKEDEEKNAGE